jgi:hypothetical protein
LKALLVALVGIGGLAGLYVLFCFLLSPLYNRVLRAVRNAVKEADENSQGGDHGRGVGHPVSPRY